MADEKKDDKAKAEDKKDDKTKPETKDGPVTGEELDKRCIKYALIGLMSTGAEGGIDNCCCSSAGDYPSMGIQGWEGLDGGNGDTLLVKLGLGEYANKSYSWLKSNGGVDAIKQKLASEEGKRTQLEFGSSTQAGYLNILKSEYSWNTSDPRATVFVLMWMGAGPYCCGPYAAKANGSDLDGIYQHFLNGWAQAAVSSQYWEGYNNRTNNTYEFCKQIDMNKDPDPSMVVDMSGGAGSGMGFGNVGYGFNIQPAGADHVKITKLPIGKTNPCEPIYPDLITVSDTVPQWVLDATVVEANKKAEEEYKKGQQAGSDEAKELEEDKKDAEAYAKFKEDQFVKWLTDNGHGYNSAETLKQCQEMYASAAAADDGKAFLNGVYFGKDEAAKKKAQEFQEREKKRKEKLEEKESSKKDEKAKEGDKTKNGGESKDASKAGGTEKADAGKSGSAS